MEEGLKTGEIRRQRASRSEAGCQDREVTVSNTSDEKSPLYQIQARSWDLGMLLYQDRKVIVSNTGEVLGPWDAAVLNTSNGLAMVLGATKKWT
jgi:hypothetical protein